MFVNTISKINWCDFYKAEQSADSKCNIFFDIFTDIIKSTIPTVTVFMTPKDKPWVTPYIKHLINQRWNAYRAGNFFLYNDLKVKVKNMLLFSKKKWASKVPNASSLWSKVNFVRGKDCANNINKLFSNYSSISDALNNINSSLCDNFVTSSLDSVDLNNYNSTNIWHCEISEHTVYKLLCETSNLKKSFGSELIPNSLYFHAANYIAGPLCHIFNLSISSCTMPSLFKFAHVSPIPKCANPSLKDIRPISLLPLPAKIFEKIVVNSMYHFIFSKYDNCQYGFRPKSSTTCALIKVIDSISLLLDLPNVNAVQILSYDYSKAFDILRHDVIVNNLMLLDFPSNFVLFIADYLSNRTQAVRYGNFISSTSSVTSGVPQGSILGPILYSLSTSSFSIISDNNILCKYADDTSIICPLLKNCNNEQVILEHNNLVDWSFQNGLVINLNKCKILVISKHSILPIYPIPIDSMLFVNTLKFLGVTFNTNMSWSDHFNNVTKLCTSRLHALRILKPLIPEKNLIEVYFATVRSVLEYCSPLFISLPECENNSLNAIQKRFHKIVHDTTCNYDTCTALPALYDRRVNSACNLFFSAAYDSNHILNSIIPQINRRVFIQPKCKTNRRQDTFIPATTKIVNCRITR